MAAESYEKAAMDMEKANGNPLDVDKCIIDAANIYAQLNQWDQLHGMLSDVSRPKVSSESSANSLAGILVAEAGEAAQQDLHSKEQAKQMYNDVNQMDLSGQLSDAAVQKLIADNPDFAGRTENIKYLEQEWEKKKNATVRDPDSQLSEASIVLRLAKAQVAKTDRAEAQDLLNEFAKKYPGTDYALIAEVLSNRINQDPLFGVTDFEKTIKQDIFGQPPLSERIKSDPRLRKLRDMLI